MLVLRAQAYFVDIIWDVKEGMNIKYFKLIILIPFLTACVSTIDRKVLLSDEFELHSVAYDIEAPTWMIPDSVYNKKIGSYSVIDADVSSRSSKDKLLSSNVEENLINFFVLGDKDLYNRVEEFEVVSTKNFSFIIKDYKADLSRSKCKIRSISIDERKEELITTRDKNKSEIPGFSSSDSVNTRAARTSTALSCEIKQGDEVYNLNLFSNENRKVNVALSSDIEEIIMTRYDYSDIQDRYYVINSMGDLYAAYYENKDLFFFEG